MLRLKMAKLELKTEIIINEILTNPAKHAKNEILKQIMRLDTEITNSIQMRNGFFIVSCVTLAGVACTHYLPPLYLCFGAFASTGIEYVTQHQANVLTQEKNSLLFLNVSLETIEGSLSLHSLFRPSPLNLTPFSTFHGLTNSSN